MNEKNRARFHRAIDRSLANLPEDPFLPQRIAQRAAQSGEGAKMRNYKWILIVAVVVMMSLTAAVASEVFDGTVDWDGNVVTDERNAPAPMLTPMPMEMSQTFDRDRLMMEFEAAHQAKEGEQVLFYDLTERDTPQGNNSVVRSVKDMDAFADMMADADYFPLPVSIPEGYRFVSGYVYYGCKSDEAFRLVETVDSEDGFRAERYVLDDENAVVTGYNLDFIKETDAYDPANPETWEKIWVYAFLAESVEDAEIYVSNGVDVSAVTIPGMTKAVAIQSVEGNKLNMYCTLAEPVDYRSSNYFYWGPQSQIDILLTSDATMEETLAMFGGK